MISDFIYLLLLFSTAFSFYILQLFLTHEQKSEYTLDMCIHNVGETRREKRSEEEEVWQQVWVEREPGGHGMMVKVSLFIDNINIIFTIIFNC